MSRLRRTTWRGVTLPEMLISLVIIGITGFMVIAIAIQNNRLYARTSVRIEPQASAMLAFKRMEREIRQAMLISTATPSPSTWIQIQLPKKDADGLNELGVDNQGRIALIPGDYVSYFLGKKLSQPDPHKNKWVAQPSVAGTTLFRTKSTYNEVSDTFTDAQIVVDGIVNPADISLKDEPDITKEALGNTLFVFTPYDDNGTPEDFTDDKPRADTNLITITVIVKAKLQGRPVYHPLWTQFCLRNLRT